VGEKNVAGWLPCRKEKEIRNLIHFLVEHLERKELKDL
jgi:hypothetical protein